MQRQSHPRHRHDGTSPLPLGMDWSPAPKKWVGSQSSQMNMLPVWQGFQWNSYSEPIAFYDDKAITSIGLMEQINTTRDVSDYLWYSTDVIIGSDEAFLKTGKYPKLTVESAGHVLHVFINGQLSGRLILTDRALYFEDLRVVVSYDKAKMYDLSADLKQVVKPVLTGPWGTKLFDNAVMYNSNTLQLKSLHWH